MLPVILVNARRASGLGRLPWLVASLGLAVNLTAIVANDGYMPVNVNAVEETHQIAWFNNPVRFHRDVTVTSDTHLSLLTDVLPEPAFLPDRKVMSIGDILVAAGVASWVFWAVRRSPAADLAHKSRSGMNGPIQSRLSGEPTVARFRSVRLRANPAPSGSDPHYVWE